MNEICAWDLDGTIRPGSLLADAINHGVAAGFIDAEDYADPSNPTYAEVDNFVKAITGRSRNDFLELTHRLSDEARDQAYPWALERIESQSESGQVLVLSHSPDFPVKAFCRGLNLPTSMGSFFHTRELTFSGRAVELDKRRMLAKQMRKLDITRLNFAAGDSEADLPILSRADSATVVNPKLRLAEIAIANNWEIIRT